MVTALLFICNLLFTLSINCITEEEAFEYASQIIGRDTSCLESEFSFQDKEQIVKAISDNYASKIWEIILPIGQAAIIKRNIRITDIDLVDGNILVFGTESCPLLVMSDAASGFRKCYYVTEAKKSHQVFMTEDQNFCAYLTNKQDNFQVGIYNIADSNKIDFLPIPILEGEIELRVINNQIVLANEFLEVYSPTIRDIYNDVKQNGYVTDLRVQRFQINGKLLNLSKNSKYMCTLTGDMLEVCEIQRLVLDGDPITKTLDLNNPVAEKPIASAINNSGVVALAFSENIVIWDSQSDRSHRLSIPYNYYNCKPITMSLSNDSTLLIVNFGYGFQVIDLLSCDVIYSSDYKNLTDGTTIRKIVISHDNKCIAVAYGHQIEYYNLNCVTSLNKANSILSFEELVNILAKKKSIELLSHKLYELQQREAY